MGRLMPVALDDFQVLSLLMVNSTGRVGLPKKPL
jgi:hypothetical protein